MGNKVNPVSFRLHQTKDWDSLWHNKSDFAKKFNEDILIKEFITNFFYLRNVSVSNFYINRNHKSELFIYFNIYLINNKNSSKLFQKNFRKNFYSRKKLISSSKLGGYNDRKVSFKDSSLFTKKSWRKFSPNKSINHLQLVTIRPSSNFLLNYNSFLKNYITGFKNTKKKYLSNKKKNFSFVNSIKYNNLFKNKLYFLLQGSSFYRKNLYKSTSYKLYKNTSKLIQLDRKNFLSVNKTYTIVNSNNSTSILKYYLKNNYFKNILSDLIVLYSNITTITRRFWKFRFKKQKRYFWKYKKNPPKNKKLSLYLHKRKTFNLSRFKTSLKTVSLVHITSSNEKSIFIIRNSKKKYLKKSLNRFIRRFVWFFSTSFLNTLERQVHFKGIIDRSFYLNYFNVFNCYYIKFKSIKYLSKKKLISRVSLINKINTFSNNTTRFKRKKRITPIVKLGKGNKASSKLINERFLKFSIKTHLIYLIKKKQKLFLAKRKKKFLRFKWKPNKYKGKFFKKKNTKTYKLQVNNTKSFYLSHDYYYYLLMYYNSTYLNTVVKKITSNNSLSINWGVTVTTQNNLTSTDIGTYIKKSLSKRRFQRKLFNPLRLVKDKLGDELVFFRRIHRFKLLMTHNSMYNTYYLNILKKKTFAPVNNNFSSVINLVNYNQFIDLFSLINKKYYLTNLVTSIFKPMSTVNNSFYYSKFKTLKKNKFFSSILDTTINSTKTMEFIFKKNYQSELFRIKKNKASLLSNYTDYISYYINQRKETTSSTILKKNKVLNYKINDNLTNIYKKQYWNIISGYQVNGYGRLGTSSKSTRSTITTYKIGKVVKNTLDYNIDYNHSTQITKNGIYGIKVFKLYKVFNVKKYINKLLLNYTC